MSDYDYQQINEPLLAWYGEHKRVLPWRSDPKPYYVWISEIMLQQTRVEAVKEYFQRFIKELPDIPALAHVSEDKLLKLWEGLGYYRRSSNLKKAAILLEKEYNSQLPADYEALKKLPGIGNYTAGAIASIAFGIPVPAVDGNVLRVAKRLAGSYDDITKEKVKKELTSLLMECMPKSQPGAYNQAFMDLGAMVCIPNGRPLCGECPLKGLCRAEQLSITGDLPVKPAKKPRKHVDKTVLILEYQGKFALHKRAADGLLAGLWELPNLEGKLSVHEVDELLAKNEILDYQMELLGEASHVFSHMEWHMLGYRVEILQDFPAIEHFPEFHWVDRDELKADYALPSAFSAYQVL